MTSPTPPDLDQIRRDIDGVDATLHDLLMRRAQLVEQVRAIKKASGAIPLQPAREVEVLRRLAERHKGSLPFSAVARIWREIISTFTLAQGSLRVAVYAAGEEQGLWDLARDHFGAQVPMSAHANPRDAAAKVARAEAEVAVLPWPRDAAEEPWWPMLFAEDAPVVFARLPAVDPGNARGPAVDALAIGRVPLAPTGRDRTLIAVETGGPLSRAGLGELLKKAGLAHRPIQSVQPESWLHLIEVSGFVTADDRRLELVQARDAVAGLRILGTYSDQIAPAQAKSALVSPDSTE
jgi:chorismate mutase-like protein